MSKLTAIHAGQPTQGIGAAPNGKNKPAPAAAVSALEQDLQELGVSTEVKPHGPVAAATVRTAAWLSLSATDLEVRKYFRSVEVASGLEMLAMMRKQCNLAAETLQQRIDEGNTERCTGCNKTLEEARKSQWLMQGSEVDSDTGVPIPYRYCGPQCIRARNREKMLPREERDKLRFDGREMGDIQ